VVIAKSLDCVRGEIDLDLGGGLGDLHAFLVVTIFHLMVKWGPDPDSTFYILHLNLLD
jgi:hypothetical protein